MADLQFRGGGYSGGMKGMTDREALRRFAANVRRLREERGMSQSALARAMNDYPGTVQRIEEARNVPGLGLVTRLMEALGVDFDDLMQDARAEARTKAGVD